MRIELNKVTFGFNNRENVLNNISFKVPSSTCTAIVGSSGCGKSTILRLIGGMLPNKDSEFFSGEILIDGLNIETHKKAWEQIRSNGEFGFMFQETNLFPNLNVKDNILLPLRIIKNNDHMNEIVFDYLNMTGLIKDKNKLPSSLSGGMKTRVALARTFITKPKLLLLDEPFSSLDIVWKSKLYEEVKRLKNVHKTTVILVTHDIFEAINFSENIIILGDDHKIVETINIPNWSDDLSYNDVVLKYNKEFVKIKSLIEQSRMGVNS